ncbi:unnamed protein product [Phytophthora lilii]|uniref:Unnamed protein product n=1 Tax=Phytophthora lilii TaxID=2077276 RepID=A0A9W6WLC5_9STRA|nr:unnamed protein product [Phytophthora lilii]
MQPPDWDGPVEFRLSPGERYGWWEDHESDDGRKVATVHGAVNNRRTEILLDTVVSLSMISLDLARRLKLRLNFCKQLRVAGLGGVPTIISARTEVKITLGPRVVYILELWVGNIGEGLDVLLGMNFMYSAGVRLCAREGMVQLPDEETVLLSGRGLSQRRQGLDLPVTAHESLYLRPGEHAIIRIQYGQSNPQREVVWAGRGDRWMTQIIYAVKSWPVAVKVVNISPRNVWIDTRTPVARIVEFGFFPSLDGLSARDYDGIKNGKCSFMRSRSPFGATPSKTKGVDDCSFGGARCGCNGKELSAPNAELKVFPPEKCSVGQVQNAASVVDIENVETTERAGQDVKDYQQMSESSEIKDVPSGDVDSDGDEFFDSISVADGEPRVFGMMKARMEISLTCQPVQCLARP